MMKFFQRLGKALMLPVACLPVCGILMGIGYILAPAAMAGEVQGFTAGGLSYSIGLFLIKAGGALIDNMSWLFAIGVAVGMADDSDGTAGLAGLVSMYMITTLLSSGSVAGITGHEAAPAFGKIVNQFVGIVSGLIGANCYNKYKSVKLPDALAFFGGTRFVPIISSLVMGLVGLVIPLVWPIFAMGISGLGHMINSAGDLGPMLFGTGERLLLPFGLHHILVALIRFTDAGGTQEVCGQTVSGALTIFQAQLSCPTTHGFSESATRFLSQGKMPAFLGGLPGAALAMYHCARPENRHKIKGLLISGLIACVVGGTTEPLEFLFLFVAPVLYVIHALLTGLGFTVMSVLGVTIGNTDGNIIDFVVFGILHGLSTKWYMVPVVAAIWFVVYYVIFRFAITRFNLKTPGRDSEVASSIEKAVAGAPGKSGYNVPAILEALGGADNIVSLDNCITRLRLSVKDMSLVNVQALKDNRAIGVVQLNQHNLQVVIGPQVQSVKDEMAGLMHTVQA